MLILSLLLATHAHALQIEIVKPCSTELAIQKTHATQATNVGAATVEFLEKEKIPYIGSELGLNSILNTPTDQDAFEIKNKEVLAFGWCYLVNGQQPTVMPNEAAIQPTDTIRWFYGFARIQKNDWVSYCEPSHLAKPSKICP